MTFAHGSPAVGVVIVAAGMGTRLNAGMPKALVPLGGEPLVVHAVRNAAATPGVRALIVVAPATHLEQFAELLEHAQALTPAVSIVAGGAERTDSVAAGLATLPAEFEVVLVHDAARALTPPALFERVVAAVTGGADAVVPGMAVADTIKVVDAHGHVTATPDRASLRAIQTPQGFRRAALEQAHSTGQHATDDAALVESNGGRVVVIEGDPRAAKVTTPADLDAVARLLPIAIREHSVPGQDQQ